MSLSISRKKGAIKICLLGYITSYSVLKSKIPLQVPDEFWDMITEIDVDDEIVEENLHPSDEEKIMSFRKECLRKVKNITSIKLRTLQFIDIGEFVDFNKITKFELFCSDRNRLLFKCLNLKKLTCGFCLEYQKFYMIEVLKHLGKSLVKLEIQDGRDQRIEIEGLSKLILSLTQLKKITLDPKCIGYNLTCLENVQSVVLKNFDSSKRENLEQLISLNSYKLRQIHCVSKRGYNNEIYWLQRYSVAPILENKYLEFLLYGNIHNGVCAGHTLKNFNNRLAAQKEYLTILCIGKYKRKELQEKGYGPLYNFCEQIGKLVYIIR